MKTGINKFEKMIYSQNGEDGVIHELVGRLFEDFTDLSFVELGIESGKECNTRYLAEKRGWRGLMVEGDTLQAGKAVKHYKGKPVNVVNEFLTADNVVGILDDYYVPFIVDLLSIDLDGNDYWLMKTILEAGYRPSILVCEYNGAISPEKNWVMPYNEGHVWDGTTYYGASLKSWVDLLSEYEYSLVGTESVGVNAFFVKDEHMKKLNPDFVELSPVEAYHPPAYRGHKNNGETGHLLSEREGLDI